MRYRFGRFIFGGAYTWRGLFSEFYGIFSAHDELARAHHPSFVHTSFQMVENARDNYTNREGRKLVKEKYVVLNNF